MDSSVIAAFILVSLAQIGIPFLIGLWVRKRFGVPWRAFWLGALFFVLVQIVHTPLVLLTQPGLASLLVVSFGELTAIIALGIYLGLLAGVFEEPGRYIVFKRAFPRFRLKLDKKSALMFGIGWGGIESLLVGIVLLLTMFSYVSAVPLTEQDLQDMNSQYYGGILTEEQLGMMAQQNQALLGLTPLDILPSLAERLMAIMFHIGLTMMVFSSVVSGRKMLLWLAVGIHALLDFLVVASLPFYGVWATEGVLAVFALGAYMYSRKVWLRKE